MVGLGLGLRLGFDRFRETSPVVGFDPMSVRVRVRVRVSFVAESVTRDAPQCDH